MLIVFEGKTPRIGEDVFIAPNAVIIGDVRIGAGSSVWFGAVVRGDVGKIRIGPGCSIQDNVTVHVPTGGETIIGTDVTLGHGVALEGCLLHDRCLIGMNATVLQGAEIGEEAVVAAGSVVAEGMHIPARTLAAGVPAQIKKALTGRSLRWIGHAAKSYHALRDRYLAESIDALTMSDSS